MIYLAIIVSVASLALAVFMAVKVKGLSASVSALKEEIDEPIPVSGLPMHYDEKENTLIVSANIYAEGYVSANSNKNK